MINIWDKKIVLYGKKEIKKDFEYLFGKLEFAQYKDCNDLSFITEDNSGEYLIIICEKEQDVLFEDNLQKQGLKCNENYMYIKDFFVYYNPIFLERGKRRLAVWGTGTAANELWELLCRKGCVEEINFYIDNHLEKTQFKNKQVLSPLEIKEKDDIYIIVATYDYHWEIYEQLEKYGFQQKKDYIHCNTVSIDYETLLERVCFTEKRYPYSCCRPLGYCDVIDDNLFLCCPDYLPISAGSMKTESFMNCWDSYLAQILRLSVCNGTFAFCDKKYCDLHKFDEDSVCLAEYGYGYEEEKLEYPNTLMVGIDYTCNLKCPSCRNEIWAADEMRREEMKRWAEDLLENVIPNVQRLWMAGSGEVFCSPIYKSMLSDERCQKRTNISILSNGTLFDETKWTLLDGIYSDIEIVISMDGVKNETIEKLRRGANAERLKKNLGFLGKQRKEGKIRRLFLNCVLQADNVEEIYDLLEYSRKIGVDKVQFIKLNNHGTYGKDGFDKKSLFNADDSLKESYKHYFTESVLMHPLADWFNHSEAFNIAKKPRLDQYDTM